jgi:hypothetical protein
MDELLELAAGPRPGAQLAHFIGQYSNIIDELSNPGIALHHQSFGCISPAV